MKSKMFKSLSIILSFVLLCSVFIPYTASAASNGKIIVSTETAKTGDVVDITISLNNNPGIVSATMSVQYDESALTLTKVTDAGVLGAQSHKPEYTSPYTLVWANDTATSNYTVNGTIATLTFKVNGNAKKGKLYPVNLSYNYDNYEIYDKDLNLVKFDIENGGVNVEKPSEPTQPDTTAPIVTEPTEAIPTTAPAVKPTTEPTHTVQPTTNTVPVIVSTTGITVKTYGDKSSGKISNPVKVSVKTKSIKLKKVKSKKQTVKPLTIKNAKGTIKVTKVKNGTTAKIYKKIKVKSKTGAVTFKKGKYAKKTYKIRMKINVSGNSNYKSKTLYKTVKVKIK